jgi:hypothetical protein
VRYDSFHRQDMQRLAGISCERKFYACFFSSCLSKPECIYIFILHYASEGQSVGQEGIF